ncbi:hypothetical protein EJB05_47739, partial [Eragrostis curvula]
MKCLSITDSELSDDCRIRIYAPNLVSLRLDTFWGWAPILEDVPSLVEAFVRVTDDCKDRCKKRCQAGQDCSCEYRDNGSSVLLKGLSKARKLVLIPGHMMLVCIATILHFHCVDCLIFFSLQLVQTIFKRDLRCCPTFSMLKTLLLNGYWCVPDDFSALACMLEHSPVLEKLTLELFSEGPDHKFEVKATCSKKRSSAISEHLKIVEIKFNFPCERVIKVLKFVERLT